jgi:CRP-like cAMP-binding protein
MTVLATLRPARRFSHVVRVLEDDPELGAAIDPQQYPLAVQHAVAPAFELRRGRWDFTPEPDSGALGVLILHGLIVVRIEVGERAHLELLGEGDIISPWVGMGSELTLPSVVTAKLVSDVRVALLDRGFSLRTARWPEIHAAIVQRLILRARRLSLQAAINSVPRIDERLDLTLWQLADRFGRITPEGVKLDVHFTHTQLAEILAAQRPSVTHAISQLQAGGRLIRKSGEEWILPGAPPPRLAPLVEQVSAYM